jgi:2-desacetyl-2-hydroxyethyl bacteriochlorophyllide A dehydrogenase
MIKRQSLHFTAPFQVEVREEPLGPPGPGQALVKTLLSAISAGTELLIYRGQVPTDLAVDETIPALSGRFRFPLKYGYGAVGQVEALGPGVDQAWQGQTVFAFQPHESWFLATPEELHPLPPGVPPAEAVFLPNMETAVTLLLDGRPLIGEQVAVFGQGVVGLLLTALLARLPLASLVTLDLYPLRRRASEELGAHLSLDLEDPDFQERLLAALQGPRPSAGADLTYEVSGNPAALDLAIAATGFAGRMVVGSWYGNKRADLNLGGRFHRSRLRLISSQVSSIAPELTGRWTKSRLLKVAWEMLQQVKPARLITHRFPLRQAAQAYETLNKNPSETIQVVLEY